MASASERSAGGVLDRLQRDGLLRRASGELRTTRRWQGAMARAARRLQAQGEPSWDLRLPIVLALIEVYGQSCSDLDLETMVEELLPIEAAELAPPEARPTERA